MAPTHTYLEAFRQHAKATLPLQYSGLHAKARATAGGKALKSNSTRVGELHFDKSLYDEDAAKKWAAANNRDSGTVEDGGNHWRLPQPDGAKLVKKRKVRLDQGVSAMMGRMPPPEITSNLLSMTVAKAWEMITGQRVEKAGFDESQHPRDEKGEFSAGGGIGKTSSGKVIPESHHNVAIHVGAGNDRLDGHIGVDTYAWDDATIVADPRLSLPADDGCASSVVIAKGFPVTTTLIAECARVLMPGGTLHAPQALVLATRPPTLVPVAKNEFLRVRTHDDGAKQAIAKALSRDVLFAGAKTHEQIVYGVVLAPDEYDTQNHTIDAEHIRKAAHGYLARARKVGSEHKGHVDAEPVESFIAPQDLQFTDGPHGPQEVRKGSWVLGVHVKDPTQWQMILDGEYTGFSVGGFGVLKDN